MGGNPISIISSVIGLAGNFMQQQESASPQDNSAQLAAERAAREEKQRQQEAEERKRERDKVTEARELDRKRAASEPKSTLSNGAAGLISDPETTKAGLKTKLGE